MTLAFTEQPQAKGHLYISIFGGGVMHTVPAYRETPERFTEEVRLYLVRVSHRGQDFSTTTGQSITKTFQLVHLHGFLLHNTHRKSNQEKYSCTTEVFIKFSQIQR